MEFETVTPADAVPFVKLELFVVIIRRALKSMSLYCVGSTLAVSTMTTRSLIDVSAIGSFTTSLITVNSRFNRPYEAVAKKSLTVASSNGETISTGVPASLALEKSTPATSTFTVPIEGRSKELRGKPRFTLWPFVFAILQLSTFV